MVKHGMSVTEQSTSVSTPVVAESGIPFVVGTAPVQAAESATAAKVPVYCTSWEDAVEKLGYSEDWDKYTLCEFMYSHFKLFERQPAIFCNVLDLTSGTMTESVAVAEKTVTDHKVVLPFEAMNDTNLTVASAASGGTTYVKDTDYSAYYTDDGLVVELLAAGAAYSSAKVYIGYKKVKISGVAASDVAAGLESIELCATKFGVIPDLIASPKYSTDATVAAAMAAKAANINGLFKAKCLIDISTSTATSYSAVATAKASNNLTSSDEIVCWPMVKLGSRKFHLSTQLAGLMAEVDGNNDGCPYESPSNKGIKCDAIVLSDGTEVNLTLSQANTLNGQGVVTAINFVNGWVAWGDYTACYPANTDVKDYFIPFTRSFAWVGNTVIRTFWSKLDSPINRRLLDTIIDSVNIWLNGLVGMGYFYGGRAEIIESENPLSNLMAGIIKIHIYLALPAPAQEIDFVLEYDASYVTEALG